MLWETLPENSVPGQNASHSGLSKGLKTGGITAFLHATVTPQDLVNSLLLSETIYKVHDHGPHGAVKALQAMQSALPAGLSNIQKVQCSLPHVHHRHTIPHRAHNAPCRADMS